MSEDITKKSGKAMFWSGITEVLSKLITPLVNIFLARLLAPEAFGAVATITLVITFAEIFTDAGFQKYIVQHEFESEEDLNNSTNVAFWTNFSVSVVLVSLIVIFRHQIATLVGSPELGNGIAVASLVIIAVAFSSIQMARFKRSFDFKSLFFVRIGASLIPVVVTIPLAFILRNFWALVIGTLGINVFNAIVLTVRSKWKPKFYYDFAILKEMFSFTAWTLLESIMIWLTTHIDIFIIGRILDNYHLGIYRTSMSTINSYMGLITSSIIPVLFATLSRYQNDNDLFHKTYWKFFKYTSIIALPLSAGVFVYKDLVTKILLGSQWSDAAGFIGLWGLMSGATIIFSNFASEVYRSKGNPKLSMLAQAIHIAFLVPTVIIAVNYDFEVLYTARSLMRLQFIIVNMILMRIVYGFKLGAMVKNIIPALVATAVMTVTGYALICFKSDVWYQILSILICIIVYFTTLFLLFPKTRKEIFGLPVIKKVLHKIKK